MYTKEVVLTYFVCFFCLFVAAQVDQQDSIRVLQNVEIIYKDSLYLQQQQRASEVVTIHTVLRADWQKQQARSMAEIVKNLPGVVVKDYGGLGGLKTVSLRGLGAEFTRVEIDGFPLIESQAGQVDLSRYTLFNASSVKLYHLDDPQGWLSASAYSYAGGLNMITFPPTKNDTNNTIRTEFNYELGSFGYHQLGLRSQYATKQNTVAMSVAHTSLQGAYPFSYTNGDHSTDAKREHAGLSNWRVETDFVHSTKKRGQWQAKLYGFDAKNQLPGAVVFYNPETGQDMNLQEGFGQIRYTSPLEGKLRYTVGTKTWRNHLDYYDPTYLNIANGLRNQYTQSGILFTGNLQYALGSHSTLFLSSDYLIQSLQGDQKQLATNPQRNQLTTVGGMTQRFDRFQYKAYLGGVIATDQQEISDQTVQNTDYVYGISGSWKAFNASDTYLRLAFKRTYRLPTFNELYYFPLVLPDLQPESAQLLQGGVAHTHKKVGTFRRVYLSVDGFYSIVRNKILALPTQNLFVWSVQNVGLNVNNGIELNAEAEMQPIYNIKPYFKINYTYLIAVQRTNEALPSYNHQLPYHPFNTSYATAGVEYKEMYFFTQSNYTGFRYYYTQNAASYLMPAWYTIDLGLGYRIKYLKQHEAMIRFTANNISNHQYSVIRSFPMPGRNYQFSIALTF